MENLMRTSYKPRDTYNEMQQEIYRLRVQIEDLDEIIAENRAKISILKEEDIQLINNIEDLHIEKLQLQKENDALREENASLKDTENKYKQSILSLEVMENDLQILIKESGNQVKLLEERNIDLNHENRRLENQLVVSKDSIEKLESQGMGIKSILEIERIKRSNIEKQIEAIEHILEKDK